MKNKREVKFKGIGMAMAIGCLALISTGSAQAQDGTTMGAPVPGSGVEAPAPATTGSSTAANDKPAPITTTGTASAAVTTKTTGYSSDVNEQVATGTADFGGLSVAADSYYKPVTDSMGSEQSRLPVIFNLDYQTIYDDNIYITRQDRKADVIYRTAPSIIFESTRLDKGERTPTNTASNTVAAQESNTYAAQDQPENYVRAGYTAIWQKYNKYFTNDSLDHNALLFYRHTGEKATFEAGQTFATYDGPNVDVQGTLQQTTYVTRLFGSYAVTGKTTLELEALQTFNRYDQQGVNTDEWDISPYINYEVLPKVTLGLGCIVSVLDVDSGINQNAQQPNIRAVYQYGEKLSFTGRLGWEVREYNGSDTQRDTPMFSLASEWRPFDGTYLKVEGYRRTVPAIDSSNQSYDTTGLALLIRQRFLQKFYVALQGTYENSDYYFVPNGVSAGRTDDYFTVKPNVGWTPNDMLSFNVYYQYSEDITTLANSGFVDNQVGFQGTLSY